MNKSFTLNVLFTSDLHGNLLSVDYSNNKKTTKGLVRLALRIRDFTDNSLIIDNGDTIQGSPLMYYYHLNRDAFSNPVSTFFNKMNYDYYIPGNHDFNYGQEYLFDFINSLNAKTLCSNIYEENNLLFKNGFDIKIYDNAFKVLIIGATTKYIPNWENPAHINNLEFKDVVEEVKDIVKQHKNDVDLIICAYHGGIEKDLETGEEFVKDTGENQGYAIYKEVPEIDILLTGHQHREVLFEKDNRVVIQPACDGKMLGIIKINYNDENIIENIEPKLIKSENFDEDVELKLLIQEIEDSAQKYLDQTIGEVVEGNLEITDTLKARLEKHPIVSFINNIQLQASGAMISSTSLANDISGFKKNITVRNVLSTYVYANTLVVVEINGKKLKQYLERCAEYFIIEAGKITFNPRFVYPKLEHYNYDMFDGIDYIFDLNKPFGSRVSSVKFNDKEIDEDEIFTLVLNNYRASGGGDFEMLKDLKIVREIPFDVAELIIEYIRKTRYLYIKPKNNLILRK